MPVRFPIPGEQRACGIMDPLSCGQEFAPQPSAVGNAGRDRLPLGSKSLGAGAAGADGSLALGTAEGGCCFLVGWLHFGKTLLYAEHALL